MKTAIQELKDNSLFTEGEEYIQIVLKKTEWIELVEKEKEQIIQAYINGYGVSFIDGDNRNFSRPQEYYNQTYNQKKS